MSKLAGKVAVVTGGNSGIGLAIAQRFASEGAYVFITGRRQAELDKAVASIGANIEAVRADSTSTGDLDEVYRRVRSGKGRLDILVVSSGVAEAAVLGETTEENFDKTFALNARATVFTVQKAVPLMTGGGSVVLIGSIAGFTGNPGLTAYNASKAAVRSYARTWTSELASQGIRVNTLSPGPIETPMTAAMAAKLREVFMAKVPLGRFGRPEEVAAAALFLASDESSFVLGAELCVDGGMAQV